MSGTESSQELSLLWPPEVARPASDTCATWLDHSIADLGIDPLARALSIDPRYVTYNRAILCTLGGDPRVIEYRHEILDDISNNPGLAEGLESILPLLLQLQLGNVLSFRSTNQSKLHQVTFRISELEMYIDCVRKLNALLSDSHTFSLHSQGLRRLRDLIAAKEADPDFATLAAELPALGERVRSVRSVTIGINLNPQLLPDGVTLLSVNDKTYKGASASLLGKLLGRRSREDEYLGIARLHVPTMSDFSPAQIGTTGQPPNPLLVPLFKDLNDVMEQAAKLVGDALGRYVKINSAFLMALDPEIAFYLGALRLTNQVRASGLPLCRPELAPLEERACELRASYNLNLALRLLDRQPGADLSQQIVTNDVACGPAPAGRIFILTGPNQGGKTTYTQAIGLAHVLCQAGLYVPGTNARISPVDGIYTHFPREEKPSLEAGRLGEEAKRLGEVFAHATRYSLVLLNESLSSTSPGEGLYLARDVVRALMLLGARTIFATHLHELAENLDALNAETPGGSRSDSKVVSLVAMTAKDGEGARRTYHIVPAPPMGMSYARDIASQYGISFEQLQRALAERNAIRPGK